MARARRLWSDSEGQALVLTAVAFSMLLGFMALAIDTGVLFRAKRNLQTAADSAAVAGTLDYLYKKSVTSATTEARSASSQNGFTNGDSGVTVTVNVPPSTGPNAGDSSFLEAIVSKPVPTFFMRLFGFSKMTIKARAVAGVPSAGQVCIWIMADSGPSLHLQGSYDIEAPECGIYVNSPTSDAFGDTGNGGTVNAKFLEVVGNSPPAHQTKPTAATINAAPRKSPWGDLPGPTPTNGGCTTTDPSTTTLTGTITGPGLDHAICYTKAVTINNATMGAGVYMFQNGVTITGTDTITGGTIDIYGGTFDQKSTSLLSITAPTSGTYNGIAILQPSNNPNNLQVQFGSDNQTLDGYIYAPGAEVTLHDSGGGIVATGIVAKTMYDKTTTIRIPSYDKAHPSTTPNRVVTLVE